VLASERDPEEAESVSEVRSAGQVSRPARRQRFTRASRGYAHLDIRPWVLAIPLVSPLQLCSVHRRC
jgi:hypothetical protein